MTLALDFPECSRSFVGRLDPRWKLAAMVSAAFAAALLHSVLPALVAWVCALLLALSAQLPLRWLLARLGGTAGALAFFVSWLPFVHTDNEPRWQLCWLALSPAGLALAALLLLKALAVVTLMLVLLATAPLRDTLKAAHALRVPSALIHLILLTYRFVFLVGEEFSRLRIALRVRGFRNRGNWHSYRTIGQIAGTLIVRSHDRAERVGQAMRCRGFDGNFRSLHEFHTRLVDVVAFVMIVGVAATLLAWDFVGR